MMDREGRMRQIELDSPVKPDSERVPAEQLQVSLKDAGLLFTENNTSPS